MSAGRWRLLGLVIVVAAALSALLWMQRERAGAVAREAPPKPAAPSHLGPVRAATPHVEPAAKLARLRTEIGADAISPIAAELNAPEGTIRRDLEIVDHVLTAWRTNFPREGNPVGDNDEITLALAGDNRLRFAFVSPAHRAINARGELCDRWGTPFRFHALSGTCMEIRSAGPDRRFGTADDVAFAPPENLP